MPILHVPLDLPLHEAGTTRKGKRSWERYIHELIARDVASASVQPMGSQAPAPAPAPTSAPPDLVPPASATNAVIRPDEAAPVEPSMAVEPPTPIDRWRTADEIVRDLGAPGFQAGVVIGVGAVLAGEATVSATGE